MAQQGKLYKATNADRVFVERSVMAGTQINKIADCLNITDDTLRKHYRYEIETGRERMKGEAVRVLMDSLTDGSLDAAKYVLSRAAGWTEKSVTEGPGPNGEHTINHAVSDDLRAALDAIAGKIAGGDEPG